MNATDGLELQSQLITVPTNLLVTPQSDRDGPAAKRAHIDAEAAVEVNSVAAQPGLHSDYIAPADVLAGNEDCLSAVSSVEDHTASCIQSSTAAELATSSNKSSSSDPTAALTGDFSATYSEFEAFLQASADSNEDGDDIDSGNKPAPVTLVSDLPSRTCCRWTKVLPGVIHLQGFLSPSVQCQLARTCFALGATGFYATHNEKTKHMRMQNWGAESTASHAMPELVVRHASIASRVASDMHLTGHKEGECSVDCEPLTVAMAMTSRKTYGDSAVLPALCADLAHQMVAYTNHYSPRATLSMHEDRPSKRRGIPGLPVVSLSLGDSADFVLQQHWGKKSAKKTVRLESGDALVFGGPSRAAVHGVPAIHAGTAPDFLASAWSADKDMQGGRLCVTVREL